MLNRFCTAQQRTPQLLGLRRFPFLAHRSSPHRAPPPESGTPSFISESRRTFTSRHTRAAPTPLQNVPPAKARRSFRFLNPSRPSNHGFKRTRYARRLTLSLGGLTPQHRGMGRVRHTGQPLPAGCSSGARSPFLRAHLFVRSAACSFASLHPADESVRAHHASPLSGTIRLVFGRRTSGPSAFQSLAIPQGWLVRLRSANPKLSQCPASRFCHQEPRSGQRLPPERAPTDIPRPASLARGPLRTVLELPPT